MQISHPTAIRALAHPLRLDLLDLLVAIGPATAAQCGRILGVPQANCSFHLRQLAKYGFVQEAGPGEDRRERRWQMPDPRLSFKTGHDTGPVVGQLHQLLVERAMQAILDYSLQAEAESPEWRDHNLVAGGVAVMTAQETALVKEQLMALLEPYFARSVGAGLRPQPGERHVRYFVAGTPMPDLSKEDGKHESAD
jgi:DNA-binding transcriptional ArsR family regulator